MSSRPAIEGSAPVVVPEVLLDAEAENGGIKAEEHESFYGKFKGDVLDPKGGGQLGWIDNEGFWHPYSNKRQKCGAIKRNGQPCQSPFIGENGRCWLHGGRQKPHMTADEVGGVELPPVRYDQLPRHLADAFAKSEHDADLLNLDREIALIDARIAQLLTKISERDTESQWAQVIETNYALQRAVHSKDYKLVVKCSESLDKLVKAEGVDAEVWSEITTLTEQRRRLTESEMKRRVQMQNMVRAEELEALLLLIRTSLRDNLREHPTILARIADDIRRGTSGATAGPVVTPRLLGIKVSDRAAS